MRVEDILRNKGREVYRISLGATMANVAQALMRHNCGALVVCHPCGEMAGIISERDVLRAFAEEHRPLDQMRVDDRMTSRVVTGDLRQTVEEVLELMTERRIRHLPILEGRRLVGLISIGDAVKAIQHALVAENHMLLSYIHR